MQIIGIITVCISGFGISMLLLVRERLALTRVAALIRFIEYVKLSVEHYALSTSQLFSRCDKELLYNCGYEDGNLPDNFRDMAEGCDIPDKEAEEVFFRFALDFGKEYRMKQTMSCDNCIEELKRCEVRLKDEFPARRKLIIGIGVSATLILIILLL